VTNELDQANTATRDLMDAAEQGFEDIERSSIVLADEEGEYRQPWDQMAEESDLMYALFLQYRDQGLGREIIAGHRWYLENELGKAKANSFYVYAKTHDWIQRAKLWDQYEEAQYQLARGQARRDMAVRHESKLEAAIDALVVPIEALQKRIDDDPDFIASLSDAKATKLIDMANRAARALPSIMTAERLARGEATEIVAGTIEHHVEVTIGRDQIAEILGILEAAGALPHAIPIGELVADDEAEVVDVYPVPADSDDRSEGTGDQPEAASVSDPSSA